MRSIKIFIVLLFAVGLTTADDRKKRQAGYAPYDGNYNGNSGYRQPQQAYQPQEQAYGGQQQYQAQAPRPQRTRGSAPDEEEKEEGPHPLQLLLEKSKFECGAKSDGYYADSDVGCQAFHYCVSGQKHSMMCPQGTVFHQVHLNCVPADQDICSKANQFFFVNDYLNKPLEQRGPNNTIQYHQRYYPEGYSAGDPFIPPKEHQQREPPAATYGLGPAYREQAPPVSRPQQAVQAHRPQPAAYAPPQQAYQRPAAYQPQQPARPAAYQPAARPAAYQPQQAARPAAYQPAQRAVAYQQPQIQAQAQPVAYGYGAEAQQAHLQQALQAQRAYAQQQNQAVAPQQYLYGADAGQRARYAPQF